MTRLTLDTNVAASGLLWGGPPALLLDGARESRWEMFTSTTLLTELHRILRRKKFEKVISASGWTVEDLLLGYADLTTVIEPAPIAPVILRDPSDDHVLACAVSAKADLIVSGDGDLLDLGAYRGVPIMKPALAVEHLTRSR